MSTDAGQRSAARAIAPPPWGLLSELTAAPGVWSAVTGPIGNSSAVAISALLRGEGLQVAARPQTSPEGLWLLWARAPMEGLPEIGPARTPLGGVAAVQAPRATPPTRATPASRPTARKPTARAPRDTRPTVSAPGTIAAQRAAARWVAPPVPAELSAQVAHGRGSTTGMIYSDHFFALLGGYHIYLHQHLNEGAAATAAWLNTNTTWVRIRLNEAAARGLFVKTFRNIWPARGNPRLHGELTPAGLALLTLPERKATGLMPAGQPVPAAPAPPPAAPVKPTAAQLEAIERLKVGNRRSDEALASRKPPAVERAQLPATCIPITSAQLPAFLRHWGRAAETAGWALGRQGDGHHRWVGPQGQVVTSNSTSPDRGTTRGNAIARLRRAGVPTP